MTEQREQALTAFRRMMVWAMAVAVLTVVLVLTYLALTGPLYLHMVIATILGVFVTVLLGAGLMSISFFSDKSGHDQSINDATSDRRR